MQTTLLWIQNICLFVELLFTAKVTLNGYAVMQNYVFVLQQAESTKNISHD